MFSLKEKDWDALSPKTICGIAGYLFLIPTYLPMILSEKNRSERSFTLFSLFHILRFCACNILILY